MRLSDEGKAAPQTAPAAQGQRGREPLNVLALREAVIRPGGLWRDIRVLADTGSTNADLLAEAAGDAPEGVVLVAEAQSAGRGRMGRSWVSPPCTALMFSVLLRPGSVPPAKRGWMPLLAGVALAESLRAAASVDARLKWPNDVLADGAKLAGILTEQAADAIVVGAGVNVSASRDELPVPGATSLALAGAACLDRHRLLTGMLAGIERWYRAWSGRAGDAERSGLRAEYRRLCATLGRQVRVEMPGGVFVSGEAADVDGDGRLVLETSSGQVPVSAGDVVHVR